MYSSEAAELRRPLYDRDARLIRNGFMRQARGDFFDLRRMVQVTFPPFLRSFPFSVPVLL